LVNHDIVQMVDIFFDHLQGVGIGRHIIHHVLDVAQKVLGFVRRVGHRVNMAHEQIRLVRRVMQFVQHAFERFHFSVRVFDFHNSVEFVHHQFKVVDSVVRFVNDRLRTKHKIVLVVLDHGTIRFHDFVVMVFLHDEAIVHGRCLYEYGRAVARFLNVVRQHAALVRGTRL